MKSAKELLADLRHEDPNIRASAVLILGIIGKETDKLIPKFLEMTYDPSAMVRFNAINSLGSICKDASVILPRIIDILKDANEDNNVRITALDVLKGLKSDALPAVPYILPLTYHPHIELSIRAMAALKRICGTSDTNEVEKIIRDMENRPEKDNASKRTHKTCMRTSQKCVDESSYKIMKAFRKKKHGQAYKVPKSRIK
ncbi:MAG: HEAT repeat domain-containing protein [Candidatus Micrarchaeia archaeon]